MIVDLVETTDQKTNRIIDQRQKPALNQFFSSITALGSAYFSLILIGFAWSFNEYLLAQKLGIGFVATGIIIFALKYASKRERPENHIENLISRASFPSGHSGNSFMTATILSAYLGRSFAFFVLAIAIAASRVYLEDHYLSDVLVGSVIGFLIGQILITV